MRVPVSSLAFAGSCAMSLRVGGPLKIYLYARYVFFRLMEHENGTLNHHYWEYVVLVSPTRKIRQSSDPSHGDSVQNNTYDHSLSPDFVGKDRGDPVKVQGQEPGRYVNHLTLVMGTQCKIIPTTIHFLQTSLGKIVVIPSRSKGRRHYEYHRDWRVGSLCGCHLAEVRLSGDVWSSEGHVRRGPLTAEDTRRRGQGAESFGLTAVGTCSKIRLEEEGRCFFLEGFYPSWEPRQKSGQVNFRTRLVEGASLPPPPLPIPWVILFAETCRIVRKYGNGEGGGLVISLRGHPCMGNDLRFASPPRTGTARNLPLPRSDVCFASPGESIVVRRAGPLSAPTSTSLNTSISTSHSNEPNTSHSLHNLIHPFTSPRSPTGNVEHVESVDSAEHVEKKLEHVGKTVEYVEQIVDHEEAGSIPGSTIGLLISDSHVSSKPFQVDAGMFCNDRSWPTPLPSLIIDETLARQRAGIKYAGLRNNSNDNRRPARKPPPTPPSLTDCSPTPIPPPPQTYERPFINMHIKLTAIPLRALDPRFVLQEAWWYVPQDIMIYLCEGISHRIAVCIAANVEQRVFYAWKHYHLSAWGCGGVVVRLIASHLGELGSISRQGRSRIYACGNRAPAGFLGDLPFPPPLSFRRGFIIASLHTHRLARLQRYWPPKSLHFSEFRSGSPAFYSHSSPLLCSQSQISFSLVTSGDTRHSSRSSYIARCRAIDQTPDSHELPVPEVRWTCISVTLTIWKVRRTPSHTEGNRVSKPETSSVKCRNFNRRRSGAASSERVASTECLRNSKRW
ncbi:hypothetical protein PR048_000595 [Dryococelus australis]|uniref:Uncharacterized protein n=1 Tax=Dryococelus australis TaxID=614101 RepID=A0ABQ9IGH6_9NEOP|nr:hypothetical protein PR048_000595 [Dryococelus australis]